MSATIDAYSDWDAAYVLGALSSRERLDYEDHLSTCPRCSAAVAEVSGMPGLLSRVSIVEIPDAAADQPVQQAAEPVPGPEPRPRRRRRRRGRIVAAAALGVAAVTVALVLSIGGVENPPAAQAETLHLDSTGQTALSADVRVVGEAWGTALSTHCRYKDGGSGAGNDRYGDSGSDGGRTDGAPAASDRYGLYVTDDAGDSRLVSSWSAAPGTDVRADGSTDVPIDRITMVDIRALDSDDVLLQAELDR
ncbi:zf-HC2 domain-containing protein [Leifsonia flava]|uniref:Zf-HC2 domain-containing protein n=1 Tax=Orlajensenia leifsoniae TaxID=2561933 RepID=A0A4Y9R5D4_9MICO|nr:zf-HC2 domain-containing protein [Leifsonia flava]TFV99288.1 zf-HC2 domain-containing protein [Leifsonia flava]